MRRCVLFTSMCVWGCLALWGQSNDRERYQSDVFNANRAIDNQLQSAKWKAGSWFFVPEWLLQQLGYNSNVFADEFNPVSDYVIEPGVGVALYYRPNPKFIWKNELRGSYAYYFDVDQLRGFQYLGETRMFFLQKRFNLDLGARFTRDQQRLNSEIDSRSFNENSVYDLNSVIDVGSRAFLKARFYYRELNFDRQEESFDPVFSELERDEFSSSLTYLVKLRPQFWPFIQVSYLKGFFDSADNRRDNSMLKGAFLGFRNEFLRRTHFNLRFGVSAIEFPNDPAADEEEFDLRGFYTRKITRRTSFDVSAVQTPIYSVYESYNYYLSRRLALGGLFETAGKWGLGPMLTVGSNDYSLIPGLSTSQREDDWLEYGIRLKFPPQILKEVILNFSFYDRNSNIDGLSDEGFQIYTSLSSSNF